MLRKVITFEDFNGETISEEFFFYINEAEFAELQYSKEGGYQAFLQTLIDAKGPDKGSVILATLKDIILLSVGRKSADGRRFIKDDEARENLTQTNAYPKLFMELGTDAEASAAFMRNILPTAMQGEVDKAVADVQLPTAAPVLEGQVVDDRPAYIRENREPTQAELAGMSKAEMVVAFQRKQSQS